jgi:hypothetical protein
LHLVFALGDADRMRETERARTFLGARKGDHKMRMAIASAIVAVLLAACATVGGPQTIKIGKTTLTVSGLDGYNRLAVQQPDPNGPNIFVVGNEITVDQEPVRPRPAGNRVTVVWRLDASSDASYSFPDDDAIKFKKLSAGNDLPSDLDCGTAGAKKRTFICTYTKPDTPREWKYSVKLKNSAGSDPTPLDPWIYQP